MNEDDKGRGETKTTNDEGVGSSDLLCADNKYSITEIKEAFIKYYNSSRTINIYEALTKKEDNDAEFNDFLRFLST